MNTNMKLISETIGDFCKFCSEVVQDYDYNYEEVNRLDKETQDHLHILELSNQKYKERAKLATQLAECRRERRAAKDYVEDTENLVRFLKSDNGVNFMNTLKIVLGNTRKAEEYHRTRTYKFRILGGSKDN